MQEIGLPSGLQSPEQELQESSKPGPVPWVIALLSLAILAYFLPKQLNAIHQDVDYGVRSLMATSDTKHMDVVIDGRDVTLTGKVTPKFERDWFLQSVASLSQVRVAHDNLSEHDPRQEARQARVAFQNSIRSIDSSSIGFEPSSSEFTRGSEGALDELVALLIQHPDRRIKVAGHTDASGRKQVNLELSRDRAEAITSYLKRSGVSATQLLAQGYGSSQPIASNDTEAGRARNRRIELIVMN